MTCTVTFRVTAHADAQTPFVDSRSVECKFSMTPLPGLRKREDDRGDG